LVAAGQTDTYRTEKRFLRQDGTTIWVAVSASIVRDDHSQPLYGIRIVQDITELKRAQARQKLLLDELNHRVKNMLATVQSVAMQTRRTATDLDRFTQAFEGRLMALNRAHELLTRDIGAGVLLRDLILETVAPYEDAAGERFRLRGPEIRLGPEVAVTLAMALHELTTNAAKYGALSTPHGRISIEWRSPAPDSMTIDWAETGGPPSASPRGEGSVRTASKEDWHDSWRHGHPRIQHGRSALPHRVHVAAARGFHRVTSPSRGTVPTFRRRPPLQPELRGSSITIIDGRGVKRAPKWAGREAQSETSHGTVPDGRMLRPRSAFRGGLGTAEKTPGGWGWNRTQTDGKKEVE
jgi:two-component sensor histidine kinase